MNKLKFVCLDYTALPFGKCYDVHNNAAYIMKKLRRFYGRNEISN